MKDFVYCVDRNYIGPLGVSARSLRFHNPDARIHVLTREDIRDEIQEAVPGADVIRCTGLEEYEFTDPQISYITNTAMLKLLVPSYFEDCMFLDVDTIVEKDLSQLKVDHFGAVADPMIPRCLNNMLHLEDLREFDDILTEPYFNSGVLVFHKADDIPEKAVSALKAHPGMKYIEQDILNLVMRHATEWLPFEYNYLTMDARYPKSLMDSVPADRIWHFAGRDKPWNNRGLHQDVWRKYADMNE